MTTKQATAKLLDAVVMWHAATVLSGQRPTRADAFLHRAACKFLRAKSSQRKR